MTAIGVFKGGDTDWRHRGVGEDTGLERKRADDRLDLRGIRLRIRLRLY